MQLLTEVIKGDTVKKVYGKIIRLPTTMSREKSSQTKENIRRYQVQYSHNLESLTTECIEGIDMMNYLCK